MLKKWLPAIIFAITLHLVLIVGFVLNQNKETESSADVSNNFETGVNTEQPIKTGSEVEIDQDDASTSTKLNHQEVTELLNEQESNSEATQSSVNSDNAETAIKTDNLSQQGNAPQTPANNSNNLNIRDNTSQQEKVFQLDNVSVSNQPPNTAQNLIVNRRQNNNPNERLLLDRDLPSRDSTDSTLDEEYEKTAKEVEDINNKISEGIAQVKDEKMDKIKAEREAARLQYLRQKRLEGNDSTNNSIDSSIQNSINDSYSPNLSKNELNNDQSSTNQSSVSKSKSVNNTVDKPSETVAKPSEVAAIQNESHNTNSMTNNKVTIDGENDLQEAN